MSDTRPVFRIHEGRPGEGWFESSKIDKDQLNTIKTDSVEVATSIPSPFAQIDLVKTAFIRVTETNDKGEPILGIEGNTAHHKLISDVFDVGRLFYLSKKYHEKIKITSWPRAKRFEFNTKQTRGHKYCFETMDLYWNQDQDKKNPFGLYNFENLESFYFVLNGKNNKIIGATSPITLFFAAPDARKASKELDLPEFHHDDFFDEKLQPLHQQEPSYIIYIYTLSKQNDFAKKFPEIFKYLEVVKDDFLPSEIKEKVHSLKPGDIENYNPCHVSKNPQEFCEVLGIKLGLQRIQKGEISKESDFVIKPEIDTREELPPLILPNTRFKHDWVYTTKGNTWEIDNRILSKHYKDLRQGERSLPYKGDVYPWYSADDFLEDKIVELPYPIDRSFIPMPIEGKYLLIPLKPLFFKYFEVENIANYFQWKNYADGIIEVKLKIPVKNGRIEYSKEYNRKDGITPFGKIHLSVLPFYKLQNNRSLDYYVGLLDDQPGTSKNKVQLKFFSRGNELNIPNDSVSMRNSEVGDLISKYYKTKSFDVIQLNTEDDTKGLIIPRFKTKNNTKEIHFAIDFGTTNTHIEYKLGDEGDSEVLSNKKADPIWKSLLDRNNITTKNRDVVFDNEVTFDQETIPFDVSFPVRTAMVSNRGLKFRREPELFLKANNYLLLEKRDVPKHLDLTTHLKWGNISSHDYRNKMRSYIKYLLHLVYYKALQLDADIEKTKITWLFPVSMSDDEIRNLKEVWKECYNEIFGIATEKNLNALEESLGLYLYNLKDTIGQTLTVDIGGGSTDIAVFKEDDPQFISSFKFGGNALFGDGYSLPKYSRDSDKNGFVLLFKENLTKLENSEDTELGGILNQILQKKESVEFSNFAFSLKNSANKYDYIAELRKQQGLKPVFLTFFGALIYYSAVLMKNKSCEAPRNIIFGGGGSNLIHVIDFNEGYPLFKKYIQKVFETVFESDLEIEKIAVSKEPKRVTCKGALKHSGKNLEIPYQYWYGEKDPDLYKSKEKSDAFHYSDINDPIKNDIENSIKEFYRVHDIAIDESQIWKDWTKPIRKKYHEIRDKHIPQYLDRGLESYFKKDAGIVKETLFFYPLIGVLNDLAFELSKITK